MRLLEPASVRQLNCGLGAFNRRKHRFKALGKRVATQSMIELNGQLGYSIIVREPGKSPTQDREW